MRVSCNHQIECCISEWTSGIYDPSNWKEGDYESVYRSHIKSLSDLPDRYSPHSGGLGRIQHDLLRNARYDILYLIAHFLTHTSQPAYMRVPPSNLLWDQKSPDLALLALQSKKPQLCILTPTSANLTQSSTSLSSPDCILLVRLSVTFKSLFPSFPLGIDICYINKRKRYGVLLSSFEYMYGCGVIGSLFIPFFLVCAPSDSSVENSTATGESNYDFKLSSSVLLFTPLW